MILAFGCSVTHGAELVHANQHEDNVKYSYPNLVANTLGVECKNYSVCGISNEGIFHNVVNTLVRYKSQEITLVIVGWTSTMREYWRTDNREWFIIPSWCATAEKGQPFTQFKDYTDSNINLHPRICSDRAEYLDPLATIYDTVTRYKFDSEEYETKKSNYVDMTRILCQQRGVRLIETCCMGSIGSININVDNFGTWRQGLGHPTKKDHEQVAQQVLLTL
jgi:hypothetical protein